MKWKRVLGSMLMLVAIIGVGIGLCSAAQAAVDVRQDSDGLYEVTGSEAELLKFYDVYQTRAWPSWRDHLATNRSIASFYDNAKESASRGRLYFKANTAENRDTMQYAIRTFRESPPVPLPAATVGKVSAAPVLTLQQVENSTSQTYRVRSKESRRTTAGCSCGCGRRRCHCNSG